MALTLLFTGSFDPLTNGHLDVLSQALALADRVVLGIGVHPGKAPTFDYHDRVRMIREVVQDLWPDRGGAVETVAFDGLAVDCARAVGATGIVRGLRDGTDLDYEMQMAGMNGRMAPAIRTLFLPASPETRHITATLVRQIAKLGGDVTPFVPRVVARRLADVFPRPA